MDPVLTSQANGDGAEKADKHKSQDVMLKLQRQGEEEKWAVDPEEIEFLGDKFDSGAGGEIFNVSWRGLKCVAKTSPMKVTEQILVDLANEINVLSSLRHPNLVMFLGACFRPAYPPVLLMELCSGGNLETKLLSLSLTGNKLKTKTSLSYTLDLALALNFLHKCKPPIVHRDLKPSNVLIMKSGQIKLTDFGLSKYVPAINKNETYAMTGETGSYRFMAPEVFRHEPYNQSVDVYSFGLIVFWMLTGTRPFADVFDPVEAARLSAKGRKLKMDLVKPQKLRPILGSCCSHEPDDRPEFSTIVSEVQQYMEKKGKSGCALQ